MNNDEKNELEKSQVIEISEEESTQLTTDTVDTESEEVNLIPDINDLESGTSEEKFDEDALASLPEIGNLGNEEETVQKMNNMDEQIIPTIDNVEETVPEMGNIKVEIPKVNEVEIETQEDDIVEEKNDIPEVSSTNETISAAPVVSEEPVTEVEEAPAVAETVVEPTPTVEPKQVAENNISAQNNEFVEKERKIWPIIVILVIAILGGLFAYYYFVLTKPVNVINKLVNDTYANVKKLANNSTSDKGNIDINSFVFDSNFSVSSEAKEYADISGLSAKVYYALDLKDNKNKTDLTLTLKDQKLTDMAMYTVGNKTYYDFKDAFPKVVYMEMEEDESLDMGSFIDQKELNTRTADYLYLFETVKNAVLKNISKENLTKKMLMKDIDGKKIPTVEVTYKIDYKEYKKLHTAALNAIIEDSRALNVLSNDYEKPEDVKEELISERDELSELDFASDIDVVIDIDAFTNNLVSMEIKDSASKIVIRNSSTDMNIDITSEGLGTIDMTVDKKENKLFIDAKVKSGEKTTRVALTVKANELTDTLFDINISVVLYDSLDINKEVLTLAGSFKLELNKMFTAMNVTDAVNINELSQADAAKLSNVMESFTGTLDAVGGVVGTN